MVLYVKNLAHGQNKKTQLENNEYIIQEGDTLWGIAKKHKGISVWNTLLNKKQIEWYLKHQRENKKSIFLKF